MNTQTFHLVPSQESFHGPHNNELRIPMFSANSVLLPLKTLKENVQRAHEFILNFPDNVYYIEISNFPEEAQRYLGDMIGARGVKIPE